MQAKRVLITGANSGIGYALVKHFEALDLQISALDRVFTQSYSNNVVCVCVDLSDSDELENWLVHDSDRFDLVINCAGIREICPITELDFDTWRNVMSVNIDAPFLISKYASQRAIDENCSCQIINIASISGFQAEPNRNAYIASKHALIGLTKAMAFELGGKGIRVNAIAPGIVETELTSAYFENEETSALILKNTPLNHWGQVDNIVKSVDYLINNDYVTGSTLVVDGGWTIGKDL
ncbi:3-oxoacyl-[acyl-carrier protein] reductase [Sinobacterium caligoides]|uniref:3-oxoacyl-[acyl-carrier protein] reductase n=1 Tax=Sinobacterium caligoides TaxID=933926 RepID=A0A3N2DPH6_9GAMM|nr:SDR family oxidoreductase [Sinobacterium caligoides]ROS01707.1 3-oxoacyl-[acyl-carrier protein] reductase [Sinobacterium caligoides]